jgi:hypothetical protein
MRNWSKVHHQKMKTIHGTENIRGGNLLTGFCVQSDVFRCKRLRPRYSCPASRIRVHRCSAVH